MRIRKNSKLSPLLFSSMAPVPEVLPTHVCQLNQSPWDVAPFAPYAAQLESEDSFTGNASLGDSMGAVESVASMMEGSAKLSNNIVVTNDNGDSEALDRNGIGSEEFAADEDVWKCKEQPEMDYPLLAGDQHRPLFRSGGDNYYPTSLVPSNIPSDNYPITKKPAPGAGAGAGSRRTRPARGSKKTAAAGGGSNPYEFYYYSGFGPLWGKKRRERGGGEDGGKMNGIHRRSSAPEIGEELDYVDDEDDDEEEDEEEGGRKRMRKPVKARSLKSLM